MGECLKGFNFAYADHIEICGYLDNNLQATGIAGPEKVNFKEEAKYVVSVLNEGVRDASQFTVYLTDEEFNVLATKRVTGCSEFCECGNILYASYRNGGLGIDGLWCRGL